MSTSQSTSAEVRPFPGAKPVPEAREPVPELPAADPSVEAPHAPVAENPVAPPARKGSTKRIVLPVLGIAVLAAAGWFGYKYWTVGRFMVSTDDAYVQADMAFISPKITGYVEDVKFDNNQRVKAGQPLIVIDNGDYRIALDQTQAKIDSQNKTLERIKAQIVAAQASVQQAEAQKVATQAAANNATRTEKRAVQLVSTHVASQSTLDDARTAVEQANANLVGADAQIAAAKANIGVLQAQYNEAESSLASLRLARDKAARDLSFAVIKAPFDGVMGNRSVQKGDLVNPGQKLANLVPTKHLYIVANYKETQLPGIAAGAKVHVRVDAIDGEGFDGTVSSVAPASGAVFSMLPPENATGNFTKVVQRIPVRIDVPQSVLDSGELRAGLSVVVDVDSRTAHHPAPAK
jgi:membrane fusion protein (multidrug efflux system)